MSLTSYRAAPPRAIWVNRFAVYAFVRSGFCAAKSRLFSDCIESKRPLVGGPWFRRGRSLCREGDLCFAAALSFSACLEGERRFRFLSCVLQTWQRPTLPRLKTKYHRRWGVSRPCSEWERVQPPRQNHQVGKAQSSTMRSWICIEFGVGLRGCRRR